MQVDDASPTRRSLISRLRDWNDQNSWQQFFDTYWKLIYSVAIKAGLSDQEAEDVVQETVLSVAKKMDDFKYDPAVCSFKGWLLHVTRLRIKDQLRKRLPAIGTPPRPRTRSGTATVERIPDPSGDVLESVWNEEWEKNLVDVALSRVKPRVRPEHYQMFYMNVVQRIGVRKVASMLGVSTGQVYLVKHRLGGMLKKEIKQLESRIK
jgi:RNA polymerase sigma-70 factor (ECF subfamily)